ncbi:hypothetical protein [Marinitenerispora sediminis]|uniref:hypothetical protein n=1 Tax=Marinitenerispora sediminis TaxID=1931232 RepID=UPI0015F14F88|nr:hypothetical protein [Marinitenerispora sediminis]
MRVTAKKITTVAVLAMGLVGLGASTAVALDYEMCVKIYRDEAFCARKFLD